MNPRHSTTISADIISVTLHRQKVNYFPFLDIYIYVYISDTLRVLYYFTPYPRNDKQGYIPMSFMFIAVIAALSKTRPYQQVLLNKEA